MKDRDKYIDGIEEEKWSATAAFLSGEKRDSRGLPDEGIIDESEMPLTAGLWRNTGALAGDSRVIDTDAAWSRLHDRLSDHGHLRQEKDMKINRRPLLMAMRVAASVLIVVSLGYVTWRVISPGAVELLTVQSGDEQTTETSLPDGSRVTLNRNSTLVYPSAFSNDSREVTLTGEAYFEVVRNEKSPFTVTAAGATVEVLGTSFSVNTSSSSGVEVFVSTGSVRLTSAGDSEGVVLTEGFIGTAREGRTDMILNGNPNYLSWKSGILKYESASLEKVFSELKRAYGIEIKADSMLVSDKQITTTFDNVSETEIIEIISATFGLSWHKEGRVYVFSQQ